MELLQIIPMYDTVLLPDVDYQLNIGSLSEAEKSRIKIDNSRCILLPLRENKDHEELTSEDFYPLGVLVADAEAIVTPMGTILRGHSLDKVCVTDITNYSGSIIGTGEPVQEVMDVTVDGEKKLLDALKETTIELAGHIKGGEQAVEYIRSVRTVNSFAAMFCQLFDMTVEEKYALLRTNSFKERGLLVKEALMKFRGTIEMQLELNRMNDPEAESYKRAAITKQIGLLQRELDSMDPEAVSEEDEMLAKIEAAGMPEEVRKEVDRVMKRFMQEPSSSQEHSMLAEYLDFVTSLKWKTEPHGKIDLIKARKILDRDHYGLKKVKERILEQIAVMALNEKKKGSILLFVGAPGTGKTSMGKSIAEALGRSYVRISLGGVRDEAEIRGHRRTYIGAMAGRIMEGVRRSGSMDPVMVLDEVDKMSISYNGDPSAALLEVLDPEQNTNYTDHYMNVPYDLSHVVFICTANTFDTIPQPLLDRMEVIELPGYTPIEKFHIAKEHLIAKSMEETGVTKKDLRITDGAIRKIIEEYTMEAGVRGLKKRLDEICRKVAAKIVERESPSAEKAASKAEADSRATADGKAAETGKCAPADGRITVREKDLADYLGHKKIMHDKILRKKQPGVVTGLAWTQVGGEILFIETAAMNGNGQIHLTGQLGDVMKESAETAVSLVKSLFVSESVDFKNRDIHIHIPEGAVPKDGPSAGVTMFTALTSLVTGCAASPDLAMTGEISLRGQVLPIGGLPEKLMAAERAGVKTVLIPKANEQDLVDFFFNDTATTEIYTVDTVQDVVREALGIRLPSVKTVPIVENAKRIEA